MKSPLIKEIVIDLEEIARFVRVKRKKLKDKIVNKLTTLDAEISTIKEQSLLLQEEKSSFESAIQAKDDKIELVNKSLSELTSLHASEMREKAKLQAEKTALVEIKDKFDLLNALLSAKPTISPELDKFNHLVANDFLNFANSENSLANEAEAVLKIQAVAKELEVVVSFSAIYNKNIIAIGGGFSSGKSAFVNSFIKDKKIKLPVGIRPVTAIPTFVVSSNDNNIQGYHREGGCVKIETSIYNKLSHKFLKSFNFDLKRIMPFMTIGTALNFEKPERVKKKGISIYAKYSHISFDSIYYQEMFRARGYGLKMIPCGDGWNNYHFTDCQKLQFYFNNQGKSRTKNLAIHTEGEYYYENDNFYPANPGLTKKMSSLKNICFIDTPGYDPADSHGNTKDDIHTAKEFLEQANSLLWMIALDTNGTVPASDLGFLEKLNLENKKLFIVLTKADGPAMTEIENISNEVKDTLDENDIAYEGISAYSSRRSKEYLYYKKSLFQFLEEENEQTIQLNKEIVAKLNSVIDSYKFAIEEDIEYIKRSKNQIKSLELDLTQIAYDGNNQKIENRLQEMKNSLSITQYKKQLDELERLRKKAIITVKDIFQHLN